jgi:glycosyltransferase involved in cell wall biosynthesis
MKSILYVVHRYAPYPGGSENYVKNMAEETLKRGHKVAVFAGEHKGDYNGVQVTSDHRILFEKWDLIVVHGVDVNAQNLIYINAKQIPNPILYLLILPSHSGVARYAMSNVAYIGTSTTADLRHLTRYGVNDKARQVRHGIVKEDSLGKPGFKEKYNIKTKNMFVSSGGYWQNKAMPELVELFNAANVPDTTLVLTGYDNRTGLMPKETEFVKPFLIDDRDDVMSAIKEADLYILHSFSEGFGLVLLESMINKTPWAARNIAGAETMMNYGFTYDTDEQLINYLKEYKGKDRDAVERAYDYLINNRLIENTVDDILAII